MRAIIILLAISLILAGCAGNQQNPSPSGQNPSSGQAAQPSGKGFTFTDSSNLTTTNGTNSTATQTAPPPPSPAQNNTTKPVTSGSGGQIVDVGGSIPVGPSGSGN